ncbi:S26 family signal peptidase [Streptomyces sp. LX-29]|uniref:S26 family signal peptidase n=1 Tax=Streptomyces sp. LX-29 TaxID=2900152 RepID=UPI00240DDC3B|nr:S26 family signal peptidase [Streptomyces sp. LX-29]WFB10371.1 S26 family signal peptidase [Streptomyces sp. LX-29]
MTTRIGWWAAALVPAVGLATAAALGRRLVVVTVCGASMEPTYRSGERVLARRGRTPAVGDVVVVETAASETPLAPGAGAGAMTARNWIIKRVAAVPGDPVPRDRFPALADVPEDRVPAGRLVLLGDNPERSQDSRRLGYFPVERLLGSVVRRLPG